MKKEIIDYYKDGVFVTESEDGVALAKIEGTVPTANGDAILVRGGATSDEATLEMRRALEETFGAEPGSSQVIKNPERNGRAFGFSGSWAGSSWEPTGPKPNWRTNPPKDPHAN